MAGDLNVQEQEPSLKEFLNKFNATNLVKENTCFKNLENPSCIDLFITNSTHSFQNTITVSTVLSDFHDIIITVLKMTFPNAKPKVIFYGDYSKFVDKDFSNDLRGNLQVLRTKDYESFESAFLEVLNTHAPHKKKVVRANQKPYLTKLFTKAIARRSCLQNKFNKNRTEENRQAFKRQKNYCNRLYKKERRKFY